jgi:hypothetical protein
MHDGVETTPSLNGFVSSPTIALPGIKTAFAAHGEGFRRVFNGFDWVCFSAGPSRSSPPIVHFRAFPCTAAPAIRLFGCQGTTGSALLLRTRPLPFTERVRV